jgi:hypothetical protein
VKVPARMERSKRKCLESFQVEKVICSYSKSKKMKLDESSNEKSELIIVKVEPLAFLKKEEEDDSNKSPNEDFSTVEESNESPNKDLLTVEESNKRPNKDFTIVEESNKSPNKDFSIVEESNKCPKCSISYKSKASIKNHIQVCKSEDLNQVIL